MEKAITDNQKQLIKSLMSQALIKNRPDIVTSLPELNTYEQGDKFIKYLMKEVNGNHKTKEIKSPFFEDIYANKEVKSNVSSDQLARTYSNIISVCYDKRKTFENNMKLVDDIYKHFKEVV